MTLRLYTATELRIITSSPGAGMIGLANEIRDTPTTQLIEQRELLEDVHPSLRLVARPRLRLVIAELQRRQEAERAS